MKLLLLLTAALPLCAGDLERFTDSSLNDTQRATACFALRGNKTPEVIDAMRAALDRPALQACAGANLRIAGATTELLNALKNAEPSVRAIAVRELGTMQKPEYLPVIRKAAEDRDLLVSSNAVEGLVRYEDHSSAPQLREIALMGGLTSLVLDTLIDWHDPEVLSIGRKLIGHKDPGDQLAGIRALGICGDSSDLPKLRELSKDDAGLNGGARGFGFMPAISISKAAKTAIANIQERAQK
ncbi:MAG: HEAT repeat domain-containing protein [Acidobacteriota bacterium]|nr:HEAT repeat domain-containing protein [Acidobacteriota bacterium]